jgi:predicted transcriptional regulator
MADWRFITNHGLVLAAITKHPSSTAREIGDAVGITERAVYKIISDLDRDGFLSKNKVGRQNHYRIHSKAPLRDNGLNTAIGELLVVIGAKRDI